jgi:hypothetical protein
VNLEDHLPAPDVRHVHHDLPVEPPGPQQRRVQHIGTVGGGDQDHALVGFEPVHLHQQLVQGLLALVVPASQSRAPMTTHRVNLVNEDQARRVRLALLEEIPHPRRPHADEHLHKVGSRHREEGPAGFARHRAGQQRLPRPGRPYQQHALG